MNLHTFIQYVFYLTLYLAFILGWFFFFKDTVYKHYKDREEEKRNEKKIKPDKKPM